MTEAKVGLQIVQADSDYDLIRATWQEAEELGADSLWVWDHFFPFFTDAAGKHFEGWTLLAAMAADTTTAQIGILVSCNSYRNPDLLADMARTVDHISGGRAYLGIGAGWMQKDYDEYGYEYGTPGSRLAALEAAVPRIRARLSQLNPAPVGELPIMIGGQGEKVAMRIIAEHADSWNCMADPTRFGHLNGILNDWCERVGRNPEDIERTVLTGNPEELPGLVEAGADHVIIMSMAPHDLGPLERAIELRG